RRHTRCLSDWSSDVCSSDLVRRLLRSLNCAGPLGLALLGACAVLLLPALTGEAGRALLRYDRAALAAGQWWRLLTAHLVHLDIRSEERRVGKECRSRGWGWQ